MPIDDSWGQVQKNEYVAQITDLRKVTDTFEGEGGNQTEIGRIYVDISDVNPEMADRFPLRFKASTHRSSSWMKWLTGIEALGVPCKAPISPNVLIGKFIHVREEPEANEINGQLVEWVFPRVVAITPSEERAKEIFESLPKTTAGPSIDLATRQKISRLYESLKGLGTAAQGAFEGAIKDDLPEGITPSQAWVIAKREAEQEIEF